MSNVNNIKTAQGTTECKDTLYVYPSNVWSKDKKYVFESMDAFRKEFPSTEPYIIIKDTLNQTK